MRNTSVINNDIEKIAFKFILGSFGALALLYIFLLGSTVLNILESRSLDLKIRTLGGEVRELELAYLSMSSNIDLNFSYSLGFKETKAVFATRKSLGFKPVDSVEVSQNDL